jgi:hypothetical protein
MTDIQQPKNGEGGMTHTVNEDSTLTSTPSSTQEELEGSKSRKEISLWRKIYTVLAWTPPNCRWDPKKPPQFSMSMSTFDLNHQAKTIKLTAQQTFFLHSQPASQSQTSTTTTQFSTFSLKTSASAMNKLPKSPQSCKPAMQLVCSSYVPWAICCPAGHLCVD